MTPTDHDVDPVDADARGGLSRRQLIKAAGVAGAAAWATPMIIDSLSSPAAAATVAPGCYFAYSAATSSGAWQAWQTTQPANTGPTCTPSGGCTPTASAAALAALNLPTPSITDLGTQMVTVSVKGGFSCRIVSLTATVQATLGDADTCASSGGSNITNHNVVFAGQPSTSVTLKPNGVVQWDAAAGNTSMVGVILQCP